MRTAKLLHLVVAAALIPGAVSAQTPTVPAVRETVNVHLVEVPVTVVDRDGVPVRGLTRENFEVFDQGKRQKLASFDAIDFASPEVMKTTSPLNPAARRSFLLLFDVSYSSPLGRQKAQEAASDFITRGLSRRDLAAVGTIDVDRGFRLATSFTTDRTLLAAAAANPQTINSHDPLQIAGNAVMNDLAAQADLASRGGGGGGARGDDEMASILREMAKQESRMTDSNARAKAENQIQMLARIAQTLRHVPGRKQIIFFSEGFDPKLIQGHSLSNDEQGTWEAMSILGGLVYNIDNDQRYGSTASLTLLDQMARYFRGSDVVLHAIDIQGVRVQNDISKGSVENNSYESLHMLSVPTGGVVFKNSNNINADLGRMLRQQEVVYVLGFNAGTSLSGKFHDLKVKLANVPGGAKAFHRLGYYEAGNETGLERRLSTAEVILNDLPQDDLHVAALAAAFPAGGGFAQVPVVLEIGGRELAQEAGGKPLAAEVYLYAFDEDGVVRDRVFQRLTIDPDKAADRLRGGGIKYVATLKLPDGGKYAIKSLVRLPANDKKGFTRTDLTVPRGSDVAVLPPMFIDDPERWLIVRGTSHAPEGSPYPFHINGEPFLPSATVHVKPGEPRRFAIFVYNATADEMQYETNVRDGKGATRTNAASLVKELQGEDVTKLLFQYEPTAAETGDSTLDVTVKKKGSAETRTARIPMIVQQR
jgi:VWFA-related protein